MSQIKRVVKLHNGILFTTPSNLSLHKKRQSKQNNQRPPPPNKIVIIKNINIFCVFQQFIFLFQNDMLDQAWSPVLKIR